jgi:uncharacterized protein (DUF2164 family)
MCVLDKELNDFLIIEVAKVLKQDFILTVTSFDAEIFIRFVTAPCISEPWSGLW